MKKPPAASGSLSNGVLYTRHNDDEASIIAKKIARRLRTGNYTNASDIKKEKERPTAVLDWSSPKK